MNTYEKLHNALKGLFDNGLIPLPRNSAACPPCIFDGGYTPTNEICQICKSETKKRCIALYNAYAALLEPPRNCDVGTVDEQTERFVDFARLYFQSEVVRFAMNWAQMPYAAHKEEEKRQ